MEREIANVAAACAMRGFRYLAFPPIVFDAPLELLPTQVSDQDGRASRLTDAAGRAMPGLPTMDPVPRPATLAPDAQAPLLETLLAAAPRPPALRPAASRESAVPAAPAHALPAAPAPRRFALLTDVTTEIHRQAGP